MDPQTRAAEQSYILVPTVAGAPTPYECCGLFDPCADELMSLSFRGADPFLDWLGWYPNVECNIVKEFIAYVRPETSNGVCTTGVMANPCTSPNGFEWGKCEFKLHDFARLGREGPVRDITTNKEMYCKTRPRLRLDGKVITDTRELDMTMAMDVLLQDLRKLVIVGNHASEGSADGLQVLLDSSYHDPEGNPCPLMNSNVINWAGQPMAGGAGITWNGTAIGATYDIIDVLLAVYRRIRQRLSWAPMLNRPLTTGDMILVMPTFLIQCLLDFYTCWSVCSNSVMDSFESRTFRNSLNGGMFGFGQIQLDGFTIPLMGYDWETISGPKTGDMYLLTNQVGGTRLLEGQYLPLADAAAIGGDLYGVTDGDKFLTWKILLNMCYKQNVAFRPRLLAWAPWAEAVFNNVQCAGVAGPLSPDACDSSFSPFGSIEPAECASTEAVQLR